EGSLDAVVIEVRDGAWLRAQADRGVKALEAAGSAVSMMELVVKSWLQVPVVHEMPVGIELTVPWPMPSSVTLSVALAVAESGVDALPALDPTERDADLVPGELGA